MRIDSIPFEEFTPDERLELIGRHRDSLENHEIPIAEWHQIEIDRRCEEKKASPEIGVPREDVGARLIERNSVG